MIVYPVAPCALCGTPIDAACPLCSKCDVDDCDYDTPPDGPPLTQEGEEKCQS